MHLMIHTQRCSMKVLSEGLPPPVLPGHPVFAFLSCSLQVPMPPHCRLLPVEAKHESKCDSRSTLKERLENASPGDCWKKGLAEYYKKEIYPSEISLVPFLETEGDGGGYNMEGGNLPVLQL